MLCKCDSNDTLVRKSVDTHVHANYTDSQLVTHPLKQNGQLITQPWKHNCQLVTEKSVWRVDPVTIWLASEFSICDRRMLEQYPVIMHCIALHAKTVDKMQLLESCYLGYLLLIIINLSLLLIDSLSFVDI